VVVIGQVPGLARGAVAPLAAATVLAQIGYPLVDGAARSTLTVTTVLLFAGASLAHAAVTRGARAAAAVLVVFGGIGWAAEAVGVATSVPFGSYAYSGSLGLAALGVPLVIPLAWVMMGWPAYLIGSRLVGERGRSRRVLVAAWALAAWDLFLDPQLVAAGYWRWADPSPALPGVGTVPITNHLGWLLVAVVLMGVLDLALPSRVREPSTLDWMPYALYLWTWVSSMLAHAAFFGLPASALWGGLGMGLVAGPLAASMTEGR
jgi:uncharacterized membrane protein